VLLPTPVEDSVDTSEDVKKLELSVEVDSEALDDCKAVLEVST
jgi:hypothetical protein